MCFSQIPVMVHIRNVMMNSELVVDDVDCVMKKSNLVNGRNIAYQYHKKS